MAFLALLALVLGSYIRIKLSFLNLWHDEVYTLLAAKGVLDSWLPQMPSGLLYVRAFPYSYLTVFFTGIFGGSEIVVRLPAIIFGALSLLAFYAILSKIANKWVALLGLAFVALSPWHIMYSVFARSYLLQSLLFLLTGWFYYQFLKDGKTRHLNFVTIAIVANSLLTPESSLNIFMLGFVLVYLFLYKRKELKGGTLVILVLHLLAIGLSLVIPSAIPAWPREASANPYDLLQIRRVILPNLFFFEKMFEFFPSGFIMFVVGTGYIFIKDKKFLVFPFFILASFFFLSVFNPFGNLQPRYLSNFILIYYLTVFYYAFLLLKKNVLVNFLILFFLLSDLWSLPKILKLDYGKQIPNSALVSLSWKELPDTKSQTEYVNRNYVKGDMVISLQTKGQTEIYLKPKLDYILRTRNFEKEGHLENSLFVDDYSSIRMITSFDEFRDIVENRTGRIWIVSSKSEDPSLEHIDNETYNYVIENFGQNLVYTGKDQYSKTYLIKEK